MHGSSDKGLKLDSLLERFPKWGSQINTIYRQYILGFINIHRDFGIKKDMVITSIPGYPFLI